MVGSIAPAPQPGARPTPSRWPACFACVVAALLYFATLRFEFVYDDVSQIVANPLIQSWKTLPLLFRTDVWRFQNPLVMGSFWRPMFMVWLMANHSLFGTNAIGYHAAAILLYVLSTCLVYRLVLRLSDDVFLAVFAALLFAVHPTHLETAAWISGATDSLMSIFLLGSLLCFMRALDGARKWIWIAPSLLLYAMALLTKETAIVGLALIPAYVFLFQRGSRRTADAITATIPFFLLSAVYLVERRSVLQGFSHSYLHMKPLEALITVPSVVYFYLKHLLWPVGLSVMYDAEPVIRLQWSNFWWPILALFGVGVGLAAYVIRSRDRIAAFACVLLVVPILPVLYVPWLEPGNFLHDRYLYLSSIGFAVLVAIAVRRIAYGQTRVFGVPALQAGVLGALVIASAYATASQQIFWANDVLLFSRATTIAPANEIGFTNLGAALASRGRMKEAVFSFEQVIKKNPASWRAQYSLGLSYFMDGKYLEAEVYLRKAVALNSLEGDPAAVLAETLIRQQRFSEAEPFILRAIEISPYKPGYRRVLALSLEGQGRFEEALQAAQMELGTHPGERQTQELQERLKRESGRTDSFSPSK